MGVRGPKSKPDIDRFNEKYIPVTESGCWIWTGGMKNRYGGFYIDDTLVGAHRAAYMLFVGPIPDGDHVLHKCDNPYCVNPDHLFTGSVSDNMKDMTDKGRRVGKGCKGSDHHGHKLTESDIPIIRHRVESESCASVARDYGVSDVTILRIKDRTSWRHVA